MEGLRVKYQREHKLLSKFEQEIRVDVVIKQLTKQFLEIENLPQEVFKHRIFKKDLGNEFCLGFLGIFPETQNCLSFNETTERQSFIDMFHAKVQNVFNALKFHFGKFHTLSNISKRGFVYKFDEPHTPDANSYAIDFERIFDAKVTNVINVEDGINGSFIVSTGSISKFFYNIFVSHIDSFIYHFCCFYCEVKRIVRGFRLSNRLVHNCRSGAQFGVRPVSASASPQVICHFLL